MGQAQRRRALGVPPREITPALQPAGGQTIQLQNPVAHHYEAFILGNAQYCDHVAEEHSAEGQHLVLCGAGPSLTEHAAEWCAQADQVWGCNSALTWLLANGHRATHGFAIDQTAHMVEEWYSAPDVDYLIASTVHPHLVEYLLSKQRRLRFFHSFVGIKKRPVALMDDNGIEQVMSYEHWMYASLYPGTVCVGSGLNAVTRAIDVARFMGFARITVLGADCALRLTSRPAPGVVPGTPEHLRWLREETIMHADGGSALASGATPVTLGGEIDAGTPDDEIREGCGRWWETKPDLMISAVWLTHMARKIPELTLIGDTLPNALMGKADAYLSRLPKMQTADGQDIQFTIEGDEDAAVRETVS